MSPSVQWEPYLEHQMANGNPSTSRWNMVHVELARPGFALAMLFVSISIGLGSQNEQFLLEYGLYSIFQPCEH